MIWKLICFLKSFYIIFYNVTDSIQSYSFYTVEINDFFLTYQFSVINPCQEDCLFWLDSVC